VFTQTTTHATLLARLASGGDTLAWSEFCDRYEELIRSFCRRQGVVSSDADDVVQDVLLALTKAMPGFEYNAAKGKFRSYLKTATLHAIFRRTRQNKGTVALGEVSTAAPGAVSEDTAEQAWEAEWRQYHLRLAMGTIRAEFNSTDIAVFESYVGAGRGADEVAAELGISVDRVYQAKSRILKRLSELIAAQVEEEG
jgi:RNA polymerase sigma-70 factor, ECF subfamily